MLGTEGSQTPDNPLLANKEEAFRYLYDRIALRSGRHPLEVEEEQPELDKSGGIAIDQLTFGKFD